MAKEEDAVMVSAEILRNVLKSQYHASLAMLRSTIENCPDDLWYSEVPKAPYWQHAYHVLYFTHLYWQPDEAAFRPWEGEQSNVQYPDAIPGDPIPDSTLPLTPQPYTRDQVLAYWEHCDQMVDAAVDALDLNSPESGFSWYKISKLEHQFVNLRHLEHHMATLAGRLRDFSDLGTRWVGARHKR